MTGSTADVVILRFPARATDVFARLTNLERRVIYADTLVYWHLAAGRGRRPGGRPHITSWAGRASSADGRIETVDTLITDIFSGYANHYSANPLFDAKQVLAGYQEWARHSIATGTVVVVSDSGQDVAVATLGRHERGIEIELAGVVTEHQGRGVYPHLLAAIEAEAIQQDAHEIVVSTQAHNTGVQRAWARFGFEPREAFTTVHVVRPDL